MAEITGINALPPEILIDIIKTSMPTKRPTHTLPREIILAQVCSHWRRTILDEPLLWCKIEIYSSRSLPRVMAYFERSKSISVEIFFDVWRTDRFGRDSIEQVVDFVVERIDQWRRMRFFASRVSTTQKFLAKVADLAAPNLQEFRVLDDGPMQADIMQLQPQETIFTGGHPALKTVQIDKLVAMNLLSNVTTLHLREHNGTLFSVNLGVITALNERCRALTSFSIHGNFDHNSVTWSMESTPVLTMRSVKDLWLLTEDKLPGKLLTAVAFPGLRSLWLQCPYQAFVQTLTGHPFKPTFPSLEYLTIQNFEFYLTPDMAATFPGTKNLHFPACNSWNIGALGKALASYWIHVERLVLRTRGDSHPQRFAKHVGEAIETRKIGMGTPLKQVLLDPDALGCFTIEARNELGIIKELTEDNYDDPWWTITQNDKGIFR